MLIVKGSTPVAPGTYVISVSQDFTDSPGGDLRKHGPFSGQAFLEDVLMPVWETDAPKIRINFDGLYGAPHTFLRGIFAPLTMEFGAPEVFDRIELVSDERFSVAETALSYVYDDALRRQWNDKFRKWQATSVEPLVQVSRRHTSLDFLHLPIDLLRWFLADCVEYSCALTKLTVEQRAAIMDLVSMTRQHI